MLESKSQIISACLDAGYESSKRVMNKKNSPITISKRCLVKSSPDSYDLDYVIGDGDRDLINWIFEEVGTSN